MVGVALIIRRPRIGTAGMLTLCLSSEAVVMVAILLTTDMAARRFALCTLVIPALLIAAHLPRRIVLAHHVLIAALCVIGTYRAGIDPRYWLSGVLQTFATVAGPAEVIYRVRRRHDVVAAEMHRYSVTDPLTGAANRRGLAAGVRSRGPPAAAQRPGGRRRPFQAGQRPARTRRRRCGADRTGRGAARRRRTPGAWWPAPAATSSRCWHRTMSPPPGRSDRIRAAGQALRVPLLLSVGQVRTAPGSDARIWDLVALADMSLIEQRRLLRWRDDTRTAPAVPDPSASATAG